MKPVLLGMTIFFLGSLGVGSSPVRAEPADSSDPGPSASAFFDTSDWKTDFSKRSVPFEEMQSGGPPKDGIPAIDEPKFVDTDEADGWLEDAEPVIVFRHGDVTKGYPLQILMWHEIVNDRVDGRPVTVTFCPLCNTAIAFDRRVDGRVLDFGTTGKLRHSDLVMYDRQTESWWQQATGEAIVGKLTGTRLDMLSAPTISWADFKEEHPDGRVLSRDTGHRRDYGRNPYVGYDTGPPMLFSGPKDDRLATMDRVVVVTPNGTDEAVAFPLKALKKKRVIHHEVAGVPVVLFHREGTASALDTSRIAQGRDVGTGVAYRRTVDGKTLTFERAGEGFRDTETGTSWTFLGKAVEGPLAGKELEPVVHFTPFWFAWAAFRPETPVYGQDSEAP